MVGRVGVGGRRGGVDSVELDLRVDRRLELIADEAHIPLTDDWCVTGGGSNTNQSRVNT